MKTQILVENLKCNGCANTIRAALCQLDGVSSVVVDVEQGRVDVDYDDAIALETIKLRLSQLGYPEVDTLHGIKKVAANARSFVSCAVGRVS